jgi:hypothetical protein
VLMGALTARARVALAQGEPEQAERDAHDALAITREGLYVGVPETLECLGTLGRRGRQSPRSGPPLQRGRCRRADPPHPRLLKARAHLTRAVSSRSSPAGLTNPLAP